MHGANSPHRSHAQQRLQSFPDFILPTSLTIFYPQINQASIVGVNNFIFSWKGFAGKAVNVERSTSLNGPWTVVSPNNDTGNYTDTDPQSAKRFYRAVLP